MEGKYLFLRGPFKGLRGEIVADDSDKKVVTIRFWTGTTRECSYEYIINDALIIKENE